MIKRGRLVPLSIKSKLVYQIHLMCFGNSGLAASIAWDKLGVPSLLSNL